MTDDERFVPSWALVDDERVRAWYRLVPVMTYSVERLYGGGAEISGKYRTVRLRPSDVPRPSAILSAIASATMDRKVPLPPESVAARRRWLFAWQDFLDALPAPEPPPIAQSYAPDRYDVPRLTYREPYERIDVFLRDGWRCRICGVAVNEREAQVDHVVPIALGGADAFWNVQCACVSCNQTKGAKPPTGRLVII